MGKMFEGYPLPYEFNQSEMDAMMKLTAVKLNTTIQGQYRALLMAYILRRPLSVLNYKVSSMLGQTENQTYPTFDQMKLYIIEGYDTL